MKKHKNRLLKDNSMVQMTLREFMDQFQENLNDSASVPIALEGGICIMKREHKTENRIFIGMNHGSES